MSITFDGLTYMKAEMQKTLASLPKKVGAEVVNFALQNFRRQGFLGASVTPWQPRKSKRSGSILVKSGKGRRSIRIMQSSLDTVMVGSDLPYMKAHNEGFRGVVRVKAHDRILTTKIKMGSGKFTKMGKERMKTVDKQTGTAHVKEHTMKMNLPKRQILGDSPYLEANIKRLIAAEILKTARNLEKLAL